MIMTPNEALERIYASYDSGYFENIYGGDGTHDTEFKILEEAVKGNEMGERSLLWIRRFYSCKERRETCKLFTLPFSDVMYVLSIGRKQHVSD